MRTNSLLLHAMFILGLIAMGSTSILATDHSKKTYLAPRPVGVNLPMEKTIWHEYAYQKLELQNGHKIRSHFQVTPFYQANTEKHDTGTYFGIGKGNGFSVAPATGTGDIVGAYLIHKMDDNGDISPLAGKVTFDPKQEIWGVRLDYFQDVDSPWKNLFFRASMPIVYVKNDMGMEIAEEGAVPVEFGNESFSLADFFAGKVEVDSTIDPRNLQTGLTRGKIDGARSKIEMSDLELGLGYKFYQTKNAHLFLSLGLTVPTGNKAQGEYLFEPVASNGKHVGFGARLDSGINLWEGKKSAVRVLFDFDYHYLFDATEHRMVTPRNTSDVGLLANYYLTGLKGQTEKPLFPAANVLTQAVRVEPGSQLEAMLALTFKSGGFVIDVGYDFYYRDEEKVWLKDWDDGEYGISTTTYDTDSETFGDGTSAGGLLTKESLDLDSFRTPSQATHKIFAGLGYQFNVGKACTSLIGLGGSYEFAQDNSALEQYALWLKLGISF